MLSLALRSAHLSSPFLLRSAYRQLYSGASRLPQLRADPNDPANHRVVPQSNVLMADHSYNQNGAHQGQLLQHHQNQHDQVQSHGVDVNDNQTSAQGAPEPQPHAVPSVLAGADPEQVRLMGERVILVNPDDVVQGPCTKVDAHLVKTGLPLHRAFSVLLFDSQNRMLLQQRASAKVTFPDFWANACCSHPLFTDHELGVVPVNPPVGLPGATAAFGPTIGPIHGGIAAPWPVGPVGGPAGADALAVVGDVQQPNGDPALPSAQFDPILGVKRAAVRKLTHELGIRPGDITIADLHFMTRIHYRAVCADSVWGEHELDYVLFCQRDVDIQPEENEVQEVRYVTEPELRDLFRLSDDTSVGGPSRFKVSPWFRHIVDIFGWTWWKQLLDSGPGAVLALAEEPDGPVYRFNNANRANWRLQTAREYTP